MSEAKYIDGARLREATIDFTMDKIIDEMDGEVFKEDALYAASMNAKYNVPRFTTEELVRVRFALRVVDDVLSGNYDQRRFRRERRLWLDSGAFEQTA